jgi:hypothetical protein
MAVVNFVTMSFFFFF